MSQLKIAIIGFGATGVSFYIQFLDTLMQHSLNQSLEIFLISEPETFIGGRSFCAHNQKHLLNTAPSLMSCYARKTDHFVNWLYQRGIKQEFPNRLVFFKYLQEEYFLMKEKSKKLGLITHEIKKIAKKIKVDNNGHFSIILDDDTTINADKIIYTPGQPHVPNFSQNLLKNMIAFESHKNISFSTIINSKGEIGILGSGLTAVDAIISASDCTDIKVIHAFSRKGVLPSINAMSTSASQVHFEGKYINQNNIISVLSNNYIIKKLNNLVLKELESFPSNELTQCLPFLNNQDAIGFYKALLPLAKDNYLPLYTLLSSTRSYLSNLWTSASLSQKKQFESFYKYWAIFRHPMPYENGLKLYSLLESGKLKIHQLRNLNKNNETTSLVSPKKSYSFPMVIDATGFGHNFRQSTSSFDQSLLNEGVVKDHILGGIELDKASLTTKFPNFYAVGQILRGELYTTNAFWFNRDITNKIAVTLVEGILS